MVSRKRSHLNKFKLGGEKVYFLGVFKGIIKFKSKWTTPGTVAICLGPQLSYFRNLQESSPLSLQLLCFGYSWIITAAPTGLPLPQVNTPQSNICHKLTPFKNSIEKVIHWPHLDKEHPPPSISHGHEACIAVSTGCRSRSGSPWKEIRAECHLEILLSNFLLNLKQLHYLA